MSQRILILIVTLVLCFRLSAQQVYQFSQYTQNLYILNTATSGTHDYLELNLSYRKQWVGIDNSPTTFYVSANAPLGKQVRVNARASSTRISSPAVYETAKPGPYHAVGGYAAQDSYGPYTTALAGASYAFHLPVSTNWSVSFSPSVGFSSIQFDPAKAVVELAGDPTYDAYTGMRGQSTQMDINVAFWLYHPIFFFGYSTDQLLQDKLKLSSQITLEEIKAHHNVIGGFRKDLKPGLAIIPSFMFRYVDLAPPSFDVNLRLDMQDRYWAGVSYKNSQSLAAMLGLHLSNTFRLGYSFDFTLSNLQTSNIGSHELMIGLNLFNKEKVIF